VPRGSKRRLAQQCQHAQQTPTGSGKLATTSRLAAKEPQVGRSKRQERHGQWMELHLDLQQLFFYRVLVFLEGRKQKENHSLTMISTSQALTRVRDGNWNKKKP